MKTPYKSYYKIIKTPSSPFCKIWDIFNALTENCIQNFVCYKINTDFWLKITYSHNFYTSTYKI